MKNLPKAYDPLSADKNAHGPLSVHVDRGFEGEPFHQHTAKLEPRCLDGYRHTKPTEIVTEGSKQGNE